MGFACFFNFCYNSKYHSLLPTGQFIYLDFLRTVLNRRRCTFPGCNTAIDRLHDIPRCVRFKVLKARKIYIPNKARACPYHMSENVWQTVENRNQKSKFTANQINDLIELLYDSSPKNVQYSPGIFRFYLINCFYSF